MTDRVIPLHDDPHREVQALLPWYERGKLDALEHAKVETHLNDCSECRAELRFERRLAEELNRLPADIKEDRAQDPYGADAETVKSGLRVGVRERLSLTVRGVFHQWCTSAFWLRWAFAMQAILLLFVGTVALLSLQPDQYHALSAAPVSAVGNVVIIFRPDTSEQDLRETLKAEGARIVDGPTAAGAYVLQVPADERTAILAKLKTMEYVVLAEPVDADALQ